MTTQSAINWPKKYTPGLTDNYVSNEIIVKDLSVNDVWKYLVDTKYWTKYYKNASDITFPNGGGDELAADIDFSFSTFGFPPLDAKVIEFVAPAKGQAARLSWTAKQDGSPQEKLDVLHAWLLEDLDGGRVRILTQESQIGKPAADLAKANPNPMLNGHQDWLNGLRDIALKNKN
ncbi:hypothetical protein INT46_005505 [Mucor plumbeus]|uniref:Polyketide cyclase n=1 Tax=Mucor plumbeus TaxID=97098 RepID=A0A8H7R7Z7_9FUNG|nr:hypothetical protein INT46_005505 [Mucor plumbeus]